MLCAALAVHVADEALTGFLSFYNPTVLALRARFGFWPMPPFEFGEWLTGLAVGILLLAALSPLAFRNVRWVRPIFYLSAVLFGVLNALGHTLFTIRGETVSTVPLPRFAPGFYSSPLLLIAGIHLLLQLRRTRR
jgi:hypothetical protein